MSKLKTYVSQPLADGAGTFILVFGGGLAVTTSGVALRGTVLSPAEAQLGGIFGALMFGVSGCIAIFIFAKISGAHLNSAITWALALLGKFSWKLVPLYTAAQVIASVLAALAIWLVTGKVGHDQGLAVTGPKFKIDFLTNLTMECLGTFLLVAAAVFMTQWKGVNPNLAAPVIGAALFVSIGIIGPFTGGGVNPARTIGPMIVLWQFKGAVAAICGQYLGATLAAGLFKLLERLHASPASA